MKGVFAAAVAAISFAVVCPSCLPDRDETTRQSGSNEAVTSDTAIVRLHISGMTCGTCAPTARLALRKLEGVYGATVTIDDSLGVVSYDPGRVTPLQIAAHLTRLTGFTATVKPDSATPAGKTGTSGSFDRRRGTRRAIAS